jgi:hypothetical protein
MEEGRSGCPGSRVRAPTSIVNECPSIAGTNHTNDGDVRRNRRRCKGKNNGTTKVAVVGKDEGGRFMVGWS